VLLNWAVEDAEEGRAVGLLAGGIGGHNEVFVEHRNGSWCVCELQTGECGCCSTNWSWRVSGCYLTIADRQSGRHTDRHTDRQTHTQIDRLLVGMKDNLLVFNIEKQVVMVCLTAILPNT
jgi:hypothetical protein